MRITFILFLGFISSSLFAQESKVDSAKTEISILKAFISKLADENVAVDVILSQNIVVEDPSDEKYDYLEVSLEEIRINLLSKKIDEIEYIPFNKMPKKDTKDIDLEDLDSKNIYFLYYKNRQVLAIYLEGEKIGSFTLVAKGNGKAHFVLY